MISRLIAYTWAAPNTALGALAGLVMLCLGGRVQIVAGVAEFHGGWAGSCVTALPGRFRFGAMTLGHVILGISQTELCALRAHEHVHVRQYEQWGLFFLPAYALSSVWQVAQGRSAHRNNFFEKQAYAGEANQALRPNSQSLRTGFGDR
ncbi:signal peptide prediction [Rhodoferax sp.]|uniref:signal peptide prediction n=1 Tax=Rhodoferax sp. TaxID=50421 RepID=UPI0027219017|nr:signal peptide prediction [Rhodoferax sp.]MDO9199072.1 signal peptide prediction [Rhodoferax sp.]